MARVTVEDCVLQVPNRFELVLLAAQRARDIAAGGALTVERDRDKNPVVALREIAETTIPLADLGEAVVRGMQKHVEVDQPEEEQEFYDGDIIAAALGDNMGVRPESAVDDADEGDEDSELEAEVRAAAEGTLDEGEE